MAAEVVRIPHLKSLAVLFGIVAAICDASVWKSVIENQCVDPKETLVLEKLVLSG